jgi:rhomboid-related protein 1/2/3
MKAADGETDVVDDYVNHYDCKPPPLFMISISAIELGVFIGYAVWLSQRGVATTMTSGAPLFSPLTYNPQRRYEAWRFFSYMFIHDGIKHILSNLIFQLLLGIPLEMVHKYWRVGIVYCLGVMAGSLCTSVVDPHIFLVGASGGCYALIGAHFAIVIMNWKEMTHDWMGSITKFLLSAPVRLTFWGLYAAVDTGVAIWTRYHSPAGSQVAYAAHFAGLIAGL